MENNFNATNNTAFEESQDFSESKREHPLKKGIPLNQFVMVILIISVVMMGIYIFQMHQYTQVIEDHAYTLSSGIMVYEDSLLIRYGVFPEEVGLGPYRDAWIDCPCLETALDYYNALSDYFEFLDGNYPIFTEEGMML